MTRRSSQHRSDILLQRRNAKMARSPHAYVRGNTLKFYEWLEKNTAKALPNGPPIWICGDCHIGNLGPIASLKGKVNIQIRDLDQTVIGNPAHDLIRLGLSLATAARGSDLPGVTTAHMMEAMIQGYSAAFEERHHRRPPTAEAKSVHRILQLSLRRRWRNLARERIDDIRPTIPRNRNFWPLEKGEWRELIELFELEQVRRLVTALHNRDDASRIKVLDAAYWVKGCSSLGRLRYAVLVSVKGSPKNVCLIDVKEATLASAPRYADVNMPKNNAARVVEGARNLAPNLGERMLATSIGERAVVMRELMPQDLKLEIDQMSRPEAISTARFLATIVGEAHSRQMTTTMRRSWRNTLVRNHPKTLEAPTWLWASILELVANHEAAYLEHCRRHAPTDQSPVAKH